MKTIKKATAILLVLIIAALSGCGGDTSWAYELNGNRIPAGLYINFMMTALSDLEAKEMESADHGDSDHAHPTARELIKGVTDGVPNSDIIKREAALLSAEYFAVADLFDELGLTLSDSDRSSVAQYVDYIWSASGEELEKNGIGRQSAELYQIYDMKRGYLFAALYGEGGERQVPEQELKDAFRRDYTRVEVMYVDLLRTSDEADEAERAKAEEYFERYRNGEEIEQLDFEYRQSIASEDAASSAVKGEPGANTSILYTAGDTGDSIVMTAIMEAAVGEPMLVEEDGVYYIFKRLDILEKPEDFEEYRESLLYDLKFDEYEQYLRELAQGIALNANEPAIKRFTPEKLKLD